jgi:hypothetical protein
MSRSVFFSFAYNDVKNFKANVVRQSWLINNSPETFIDGSIWETEKTKSPTLIKELIDNGMNRSSVTAVLIGEETANRRWINYEIVRSFERGNGIIGIHINRIRGKDQAISSRGSNPLDRLKFTISDDGKKIKFYELVERKWIAYADLPEINNKKSNTLYFENSFWSGNDFGKSFCFSDKFQTYCWILNSGHSNFSSWISEAADQAGR